MCILWTKHLINLNLGCVTMLSFIPSTYQGTCNQEKSEHFIYVYKPNLKETKLKSSETISEKYLQILEEIFYMYIYTYMSVFSIYKYIIIITIILRNICNGELMCIFMHVLVFVDKGPTFIYKEIIYIC